MWERAHVSNRHKMWPPYYNVWCLYITKITLQYMVLVHHHTHYTAIYGVGTSVIMQKNSFFCSVFFGGGGEEFFDLLKR